MLEQRFSKYSNRRHSFSRPLLILFLLLSGADWFLTWWLVSTSGGQVYETNPLARVSLTAFGWNGLLAYKVCTVLIVLAAAMRIARTRPRTSRLVLSFSCLVTGIAVLYSGFLGGVVQARESKTVHWRSTAYDHRSRYQRPLAR